jgi:probable HAF family extracellular repeat protein
MSAELSALWAVRMGHACLGGGLFLVGVWAVCRLAPRLPATLRASLWWLACLKLVLDLAGIAPLALPMLPAVPALRTVLAVPPGGLKSGPRPTISTLPPAKPSPADMSPVLSVTGGRNPSFSWPLLLLTLWLAGVAITLLRITEQGLRLSALVKAAQPISLFGDIPASLPSLPPVRESAGVSAPCVAGLFRPIILLPRNITQTLSPDEIQLALAHELAHLQRCDLWMALLPAAAQALFFFHPLVWLGCREWAAAREEACDALALRMTGAAPVQLGHLLLKLAGSGTQVPALGLSPGYRTLKRRLIGLSSPASQSRHSRWLVAVALLALVPWRLTAAVRSASLTSGAVGRLSDHYSIRDLGDAAEAAGLNEAGQAALTWRDGSGTQGLSGSSAAVTLLGALPKHHYSSAYGINALGQIAAASYNIPGHGRAFLWDGSPRRLGSLPGYPYSQARAVNDSGQVAGFAEKGGRDRNQAHVARAFLWSAGKMTDLGTLGGLYSAAASVNNPGQVAGKADTETFGQTHAFLWQNGAMQDLGTLGGANSLACRVSDTGTVVGCAETGEGDTRHAFVWQNGAMRDLGTLPGLPCSVACGVNASGQIVGYAEPTPDSNEKRAVLWRGGAALDLNTLLPANSGWVLVEARAVNDRGQIVGSGMWNGRTRAFLLTPG